MDCGKAIDTEQDVLPVHPMWEAPVLGSDFSSDADGDSDYNNTTLYTGSTFDPAIGLYYYRHRVYHAQLGRFVSRDPVGYEAGDVNLYCYVGAHVVDRLDPTGTVQLISCECYNTWFTWTTTPVVTSCGGLAETCCEAACGSTSGWSGSWNLVGAGPSDESNPWGETWGAIKCVQNCVNETEGVLTGALTGLGTISGYTYSFSTVPKPTGTWSPSPKVSRISVWASKTKDCCPSLSRALLDERNATQALRSALKLKLPPGLANSLSVALRGGTRACQFTAIVEAPIYMWCSSQCMNGKKY